MEFTDDLKAALTTFTVYR